MMKYFNYRSLLFILRVDSVLDPWAFHLKVSGSGIITMPDGSNVRKCIVDVLHRLQMKLLRDDEGDTKSFRSIINVSFFIVPAKVIIQTQFCF